MFRKLKNKKIASIVTITVSCLLIIGILSAVIFIKPKSVNKISSSEFVIGKIDSHGKFAESDDYICSKNYIACDGLVITPNFTTDTKFQVFFYDVNGNFVKNTGELSSKYRFVGLAPYVEYCKIMLIPNTNGKPTSEFKIKSIQKSSYVKDFEITVDKEQVESSFVNYFNEDELLENKKFTMNWNDMSATGYSDDTNFNSTKIFTVNDDLKKFYFLHDFSNVEQNHSYVYFLSGDKVVHYKNVNNYADVESSMGFTYYEYEFDIQKLESKINEQITHFVITVDKGINCYLYSNVELS